MNRLLVAVTLAVLLLPEAARAQVAVRLDLGLPAAPRLVVIQPGVHEYRADAPAKEFPL